MTDLKRIHPVTHRDPFFRGMRQSFCGPSAVSAITGRTAECAAAWMNFARGEAPHFRIRGSYTNEVKRALCRLGYDAVPVATGPGRPTVARWLRERTPERRRQTFLIVAGNHFQVVRGNKAVCSLNAETSPTSKGKKRRARIVRIYRIVEGPGELAAAIRARRSDPMPPWDRCERPNWGARRPTRPWPKSAEVGVRPW